MPVSLNAWQLLGLILASAMAWLHYVQLKDRNQPEPLRRILTAFALGIGAALLAMLVFIILDALDVPDIKFGERAWTGVYCLGFIGPIEEGSKVLLAYLFVFRWREFDEPIDGFVYAAALALGFASTENFFNASGAGWPVQLARTVALPITHVLFSAIWGFGIGYARFCMPPSSRRTLLQAGSVALGMFAHGLYDYFLLAHQATLASSGVALMIWLFVIWRARALAQSARLQAQGACGTGASERVDAQ